MSIFKAYDIRGVYPSEINEDIIYRIGRAYVIKFKPKKITVGRDMRISSSKLFEALVKGVTDQGCDVVDIGLVTTPMMYYSVWNYKREGGLMVSASHNPSQYNGVKMVGKGGVPISGETGIFEIGEMIGSIKEPLAKKKGTVEKLDLMAEYVSHSLKYGDLSALKRFKIVIDTANAMGGPVSSLFFRKMPCELVHMFSELDGNFPNHEANPLNERNLKSLQEEVLRTKADLGISFDGDADRCAFVDEKGAIIQSDLITGLVAKAILENRKGAKILFDVRSSKVVGEVIKECGGVPGRCKVGHSLVKTQMRLEKAYFAGELSGHYYVEDEHYAEAPFFIVLKILSLMSETGKKMSELAKPLRKYTQSGEINSEVRDKEGKMKELSQKFKDANVSWMDGVTIEYPDWWANIRPSNTEPFLRLNLEADTKKKMEEKRDMMLKLIRA
ncbi:MAG: phosphomannomutase/phosphoglucomutase [Nanoarchaeota archaeon]|nr:phosphomannomutase/phosphoglucomutase [Nanoarchaeota archaeon]